MSNPLPAATQIATSGNARSYGIPALALQWVGADGSTLRICKTLSSAETDMNVTLAQGVDNANEYVTFNPSQNHATVKLPVIPVGALMSDAAAIGNDLPRKGSLINIGHITAGAFVSGSTTGAVVSGAVDPQIETSSAIVESVSKRRTPAGELVLDFTLTVHYNLDGSFKVFAAVTA